MSIQAADALMGIFGFKRVEEEAMDKVSETRRVLFEAKLLQPSMEYLYTREEIGALWEGFNAALDAVEIDLPKEREKRKWFQHETIEDSAFNECHYLCIDAIESANLGLRIK